MEKGFLLRILKSIIITFSVSLILSYFITFTGIPFLPTFLVITLLQFLFFYFYGEYLKNKKMELIISAEAEITKEKLKQFTDVECPCDRKIQTNIPLNIYGKNNYVCPGCNKQVNVYIETKTALSTEPVFTNPLDSPLLTDEVEKLIKNANK